MIEPAGGLTKFRQFFSLISSTDVPYRWAMLYSVSVALTVRGTQPVGIVHETLEVELAGEGGGVLLSTERDEVIVNAGDANSTGRIVGVGCGFELDSVSARDMPPITRMMESSPIKKPPPICRNTCMVNSPKGIDPLRSGVGR